MKATGYEASTPWQVEIFQHVHIRCLYYSQKWFMQGR
jgi:hypothetical protein